MNKCLSALFILYSVCLFSYAQPGSLDLSFNPGTGVDNRITATAIQSDGKIIIGGDFNWYNGTSIHRIARLNSDGILDTSFHVVSGANSIVNAIAIQADGKIVIGGNFDLYNGTTINYLARINTDGSLDTTFVTGTGPNGYVKAIAIQPGDGKILIAGEFTSCNGTTRSHLARLNTDGSVDGSFNSASGANGTVECIAIQPSDGKIMIGGSFTMYGLTGSLRLARVNTNGSPDTGFNPLLGGASSTVATVVVQNDGKIIFGGNFTNYNSNFINRLARIVPNGALDNTFFPGQGAASTVYSILVLNNNDIVIGGGFTKYDTDSINRIVRLLPDGTLDTEFNSGTGSAADIHSMALQADGKTIIAGDFTSYNGVSRSRVARLYNCLTTQPDSIYGNSYAFCSGTHQIYSVTPVAGATKYEWTLPNGWTGNSDSTSIIATSSGSGGIISVKAFTDSCGYSYATIRTIATIQPPGVDICLVTVDTQSTHNIVVWEKPQTALIDSFFIYRETSTNVYTKIAGVAYDSLSEYHDYAANPNATSYRYKLSVLDTCGAESALSPYHSTIHFQNLGSGNFQWTFYRIEGSSNPVLSFNVYRDNLGNGNFFPIGSVPGTNATFSDVTFSSFLNSIYVVDVDWAISCSPGRSVNTTRSNIRHRNMIDQPLLDIKSESLDNFEVFPNPAEKMINLVFPKSVTVTRLEMFNSIGQVVFSEISEVSDANIARKISVEDLPRGFYTLKLKTNLGSLVKRLIIQ